MLVSSGLQWLDASLVGVLGLLIGSFLNVVIHRLPKMMEQDWAAECAEMSGQAAPVAEPFNLMVPRSRCPHCGHQIRWFENIPVFSYIALRGACSACRKPISMRYPAVELVTGALFYFCATLYGASWLALAWATFCALLIALFLIDFDTHFLPDDLNYLLLWLGLVISALGWSIPLKSAVWGAFFGYVSLWSVFHVHHYLTGKIGLGHGDFKLLAALGAWFGAENLIAIILLSSVVGSLLGGISLWMGRLAHKDIHFAFGPFLAGAGLLMFVVGPATLVQWVPFISRSAALLDNPVLRLGLTGGIGSGKSTVAAVLANMGAALIDADAIARATTAPGGSAMNTVLRVFGATMLAADGALDRDQMRTLVFSDPTAKSRLEAIIHPLVGAEIARQAQQAAEAGVVCAVFDIPLLVESGHWRATLDRVLVVDCTEATQMARVMARNGLQAPEVQRIIDAQASRAQRLAAADVVLFNDSIPLDDLRERVQQIGTQFGL